MTTLRTLEYFLKAITVATLMAMPVQKMQANPVCKMVGNVEKGKTDSTRSFLFKLPTHMFDSVGSIMDDFHHGVEWAVLTSERMLRQNASGLQAVLQKASIGREDLYLSRAFALNITCASSRRNYYSLTGRADVKVTGGTFDGGLKVHYNVQENYTVLRPKKTKEHINASRQFSVSHGFVP